MTIGHFHSFNNTNFVFMQLYQYKIYIQV